MIKNGGIDIILNGVLGLKVTGIVHNYYNKTLSIYFEGGSCLHFNGCVIVFDLGIMGHKVGYVAPKGTLGLTLEFEKLKLDPSDYNFCLLSRDIADYKNKNEIVLAFKDVKLEETQS